MKINEISQVADEYENDFIFAFCTFLDEFYAADSEEKKSLLVDEPSKGNLNKRQYCMLACAAHKLSNDYKLNIPRWSMKKNILCRIPFTLSIPKT